MDPADKILLIGSGGMLGRAWLQQLKHHGIVPRLVRYPSFDLLNTQDITDALDDDIQIVINCAAWTDVDGAESQPERAHALNADAVGALAQACHRHSAVLVHYSTDYVFSGRANQPYGIDARIDPVNRYGGSKAAGEAVLRASRCDHLLIRTSWLYAPWGSNFVRTIARLADVRESLSVVDDQRGRPTSCAHLAQISSALLEAGARGTYHVTDGGECTWFEFAREIVRLRAANCTLSPCTSETFPRPAKRPRYSTLDISGTERMIGSLLREWRENLADVVQQLEETIV